MYYIIELTFAAMPYRRDNVHGSQYPLNEHRYHKPRPDDFRH